MKMLFGCSELVADHYQSMVADHLALISCYPRDPRHIDEDIRRTQSLAQVSTGV